MFSYCNVISLQSQQQQRSHEWARVGMCPRAHPAPALLGHGIRADTKLFGVGKYGGRIRQQTCIEKQIFDSYKLSVYIWLLGDPPDPHRSSAPGPRWGRGFCPPTSHVPTPTSEPGYAAGQRPINDAVWILRCLWRILFHFNCEINAIKTFGRLKINR